MKKLLLLLCALTMSVGTIWADSYYVVGAMNDWKVDPAYKMTVNPSNSNEYMISDLEISTTGGLKVVSSDDDATASQWYPAGTDNNYSITSSGTYTIYFNTSGNGGDGWHYGYIYVQKKYTAKFANSIGWHQVYAYTYGPETLGSWPGTPMTKEGGTHTVSFYNNTIPSNIIFSNGVGSEEGISKTSNLTFTDNNVEDLAALPTSGNGSYEVTVGQNAGKTLSYSWEYTQTGQDVTLTFAVTNDGGITALVNGSVRDRSDGGTTYYAGLSHTWKDCTPGQIIKADHQWACTEADIFTDVYPYIVKDNTTPIADITSISVTAASNSIDVGNTTQLTVKDMNSVTIAASNITFESSDNEKATVTASGLVTAEAAGEVTITAKLTDKPSVSSTVDITVTVPFVAPSVKATQPDAEADVLVVHSSTYGISLDANNDAWGGAPKPVYGSLDKPTVDGTEVVHVTRTAEGLGVGMPGRLKNKSNATTSWSTDYYKVYASVYPNKATKCRVYEDIDNSYVETAANLIPNQWNYVEITVSSFNTSKDYMTVYLPDATECYIDHFYFAKLGTGEMDVNVVGNKATVIGTVTSEDVATLVSEAGSAAIIDLTGATISEDITINPININAVVVVGGTARTPNTNGEHVSTASGNNIVVYDGSYRRAKTGVEIVLTDDNASQPAYDFVIDAGGESGGFSYKRTVAADKWVSYNSLAPVTIPDGVDVYKATDATTSSVTFTKQGNKALGANDPVILHNTTGSPIDITSNNVKGDLNLTANPGGAAVNGTAVIQYGTARALTTNGSQYALSNGELHPFNGGTIGAFRVYYTGLSNATGKASALFVDDETTKIGSIDANGEINGVGDIYNLAGQRVNNPAKGLYIVNGKKVIIK